MCLFILQHSSVLTSSIHSSIRLTAHFIPSDGAPPTLTGSTPVVITCPSSSSPRRGVAGDYISGRPPECGAHLWLRGGVSCVTQCWYISVFETWEGGRESIYPSRFPCFYEISPFFKIRHRYLMTLCDTLPWRFVLSSFVKCHMAL